MSFNTVKKFEKEIAKFFGATYAVAVDSCTHGIELCLRYQHLSYINVSAYGCIPKSIIFFIFFYILYLLTFEFRFYLYMAYMLLKNHQKY